MAVLVQFLLRLSFGLAVGMAVTPSRQVSSGFFRNHLYVTLGLATLAALVAAGTSATVACLAATAAVLSYFGSVCWLYEAKRAGVWLLWLLAACSLAAAWAGFATGGEFPLVSAEPSVQLLPDGLSAADLLRTVSVVTSGLLMGLAMASMLLGHWYLNSPTMELAPLRRLLRATAAAVVLQAIVAAVGLACEFHYAAELSIQWLLFVVLRWSFGLLGVAVLVWMAWQTLKIPNTQSATGILYVALVGVSVGELTALLLSAESVFPL